MRRMEQILAILVIGGICLVSYLFGRSKREPKSFITHVVASERLVERFTLADSCAMLLNKVYFPPGSFVEVFYDSLTKQANVYARLKNGVIRSAVMPAPLAEAESSSHIVQRYFDQMVGFLTRPNRPYFWIVEEGVLRGFDMGLIDEHMSIACHLVESLWSPPFIFTTEDSIIGRQLCIGDRHLREVAAYAKVHYKAPTTNYYFGW